MKIEEYQILALRTLAQLETPFKNAMHFQSGIFTEFGELLDIFKRKLAYNKEYDVANVLEEIGDICFYIVNIITFKNKSLKSELLDHIRLFRRQDTSEWETEDIILHLIETHTNYTKLNINHVRINNYYNMLNNLSIVSNYFGFTLEQCFALNIEKLKHRFPEKFDEKQALNRDLDGERKILESIY